MNRTFLLALAAAVPLAGCSGNGNSGTPLDSGVGASAGFGGQTNPGGGGQSNPGGGQGVGGQTNPGSGGQTNPGGGGSSAGNGGVSSVGGTAGGGGAAGGSGAAGGGGAAGSSGAAGTGGASTCAQPANPGPAITGDSVLERGGNPAREGHFVQLPLTKKAAPNMTMDAGFNATFTGDMWASPLYVQNGPNGKGIFFAETTGNDVYALDATTGAVTWHQNMGSSPSANGVPCGNIHPLGIISTPVINATARTIYLDAATGTSSIASHQIHGLSVDDGSERPCFPVSPSNLSSGGTKFTTPPENQRSALSLVNGTVYVAYGGHIGDCGDYHGWVVGVDSTNPKNMGGWATLGQGEGIWAAGGMASDGNGVFAVTGNSTVGANDHMKSDSEELVRITGLGVLNRSNTNLFFPSRWMQMDSGDADFGSNSPIYLSVPGSTPDHFVMAISKDGHMYLLDPANLGGQDGYKVDFSIANATMAIHTVPATYTTTQGVHVVLSTDSSAECPIGGPSGRVVMSVLIPPGSPPAPKVMWCAALSGSVTSPIATTSDAQNDDAMVWFMNGDKLTAVDGDSGMVLFSGGSGSCSGVQEWTSPIAADGRIIVGGNGHLCSWSPPPP